MLDADWQALKADYLLDTPFNVGTFQWKGAGGLTASVGNFQMHNRGHGSRSPIKPGLHLTFDANVKGQTFLGLSSLELKPNTRTKHASRAAVHADVQPHGHPMFT